MVDRYGRDAYFTTQLEDLIKTTNEQQLKEKSETLLNYTVESNSPSNAYRLAYTFDSYNFPTNKLQEVIVNSKDARHIFRCAYDIRDANIKLLQDAIIENGHIIQIAKFGCFIRGADKKLIQDIISKSNNAQACYLYLRFVKDCDIEKLKTIVIKSKKSRYLYSLAKKTSNKELLNTIQDIIYSNRSLLYVRLFAAYIPGADIKKAEDRILATCDASEIKKAWRVMRSPRLEKLSTLF